MPDQPDVATAAAARDSFFDWSKRNHIAGQEAYNTFRDGFVACAARLGPELDDRAHRLDRLRKDYLRLLNEVVPGLSSDEHGITDWGGLPFCRCGFSLAGGKASEAFITHALAVLREPAGAAR